MGVEAFALRRVAGIPQRLGDGRTGVTSCLQPPAANRCIHERRLRKNALRAGILPRDREDPRLPAPGLPPGPNLGRRCAKRMGRSLSDGDRWLAGWRRSARAAEIHAGLELRGCLIGVMYCIGGFRSDQRRWRGLDVGEAAKVTESAVIVIVRLFRSVVAVREGMRRNERERQQHQCRRRQLKPTLLPHEYY